MACSNLADGILDHSVLERRYPYRPRSCHVFGMWTRRMGLMPVFGLAFSRFVQILQVSCSFRPYCSFVTHPPLPPHPCGRGGRPAPAPAHLSDAPASETVPSGSRCARSTTFISSGDSSPTSMHRSWFPPEVHIDTGRLCSAGSGATPFPDVHAPTRPSDSLVPFGE